MPGNYSGVNLTSLYGRRIGLQLASSVLTGGAKGMMEFVVGPDGFREPQTTGETTATAMNASGQSVLVGTSVASTPVFTLSPPIPGVRKTVVFFSTDSALYLKMSAGVTIMGTSLGNTGATVLRSSGGGYAELMGVTTALYAWDGVSSTAINGIGAQATT